MTQQVNASASLRKIAKRWEDEGRLHRDDYPYRRRMEEILFHGDCRFCDYVQFVNDDGEFPARLLRWLDNVPDERHKKALFQILPYLLFLDHRQLMSLCRDAYRRIVVPWVLGESVTAADMLSDRYDMDVYTQLRQYRFYSITESFSWDYFHNVNSLAGHSKPTILGDDPARVAGLLPDSHSSLKGLIVLEDFVGTGHQANEILAVLRARAPSEWRLLFVPLVILESGLASMIGKTDLVDIDVKPVLVIPQSSCVCPEQVPGEPAEFTRIRTIIQSTASRVREALGVQDNPPSNSFGYGGSGALVATCHNVPNNTLPLLHHKAPSWAPLFRRVHHAKSGGPLP